MNNSSFVTKHTGLARKLVNQVEIRYNGKGHIVEALWDTGASMSCVSQAVVDSLQLTPIGMAKINTPSGESVTYTYLIDVALPNGVIVQGVNACGSAIGTQEIGMLIGMDIISLGDFAVSNYNGQTFFTFRMPSQGHTDYVQEIIDAQK